VAVCPPSSRRATGRATEALSYILAYLYDKGQPHQHNRILDVPLVA